MQYSKVRVFSQVRQVHGIDGETVLSLAMASVVTICYSVNYL